MSDSGQRLSGTIQGNIVTKDVDCQLVFTAPDGRTMIMGVYSEKGQPIKFGIGMFDSSGILVSEMDFTTWFWNKNIDDINMMQVGLLPDDTYGIAIAKDGQDVNDAFTN